MRINEKLQQLRTGKNLTRETVSEAIIYIRTAISKWESGKGYPNIETFKSILNSFL